MLVRPPPWVCHGRRLTIQAISSSRKSTSFRNCGPCRSPRKVAMREIVTGSFAPCKLRLWPVSSIRVVDWNIERGEKLPGIVDFLASQGADLLILQEVDINTRRARRLHVAEEIARILGMD